MIEQGPIRRLFSFKGKHTGYELELHHRGLNEYKMLFAPDINMLENRIHNQEVDWQKKWASQQDKQQVEKRKRKEANREAKAEKKTKSAKKNIERVRNLLANELQADLRKAKVPSCPEREAFRESLPPFIRFGEDGTPESLVDASFPPLPESSEFLHPLPFWRRMTGLKGVAYAEQQEAWAAEQARWQRAKERTDEEQKHRIAALAEAQTNWANLQQVLADKEALRVASRAKELNACQAGDPDAIEFWAQERLKQVDDPDAFPFEVGVRYAADTGRLVVDYLFPSMEDLPSVVSVRPRKRKRKLKKDYLSRKDLARLHDRVVCEISLRSLHVLMTHEAGSAIREIGFNGFIRDVDPATGRLETRCLVSLITSRDVFESLHLDRVDPQCCIAKLTGAMDPKAGRRKHVEPSTCAGTSPLPTKSPVPQEAQSPQQAQSPPPEAQSSPQAQSPQEAQSSPQAQSPQEAQSPQTISDS